MPYKPPFQLSHRMFAQVARIAELIGRWTASNDDALVPELRRGNRIRTIQASLAVEQNTLSVEQVTAVLEGKTVLGTPKEIQEVHNAFAAYEAMDQWNPHSLDDFLTAHRLLMHGLITDAGQWRQGGAGIYRGEQLVHMAPPHSQLPRLMADLFQWLQSTDAHPLIASAAFHYEFEFIHPFSDGNGRMGRLWQTLILSHWQPMLAFLPVETVIRNHQSQYYLLLSEADASSDCSAFIEFMLQSLEDALKEAISTRVSQPLDTPDRILAALKENPEMTLAEVAQKIGRSKSAVERAVAKLKKQGRLRYIGPKRGGRWDVA